MLAAATPAIAMACLSCGSGSANETSGNDLADAADAPNRAPPDAGPGSPDADAGGLEPGLCDGTGHATEVPAIHRAQPAVCTPSARAQMLLGDASAQACSSDADCSPDGAFGPTHCLAHVCAFDACLADSDCAAGSACVCADVTPASDGPNYCVVAHCEVDSDCGPSGYCSPSLGGCSGVGGFYCHTNADTCVDPSMDCNCLSSTPGVTFSGGIDPFPQCVYAPTIGRFVCNGTACSG
jgi:hypothetical protein